MTWYECEKLQQQIQKELHLHPLYVSGKFNKLLLVMSYDDIRALQAHNNVHYSMLQDGRFTIYGVTVKYSPLLESGHFELVESDGPASHHPEEMFINCPNCGAPIDKYQSRCAYCGTWNDWRADYEKANLCYR